MDPEKLSQVRQEVFEAIEWAYNCIQELSGETFDRRRDVEKATERYNDRDRMRHEAALQIGVFIDAARLYLERLGP